MYAARQFDIVRSRIASILNVAFNWGPLFIVRIPFNRVKILGYKSLPLLNHASRAWLTQLRWARARFCYFSTLKIIFDKGFIALPTLRFLSASVLSIEHHKQSMRMRKFAYTIDFATSASVSFSLSCVARTISLTEVFVHDFLCTIAKFCIV